MSAAARRAALGRTGRAIAARHGGPAQRRAAALRRRVLGLSDATPGLDDLSAAPDWLSLPQAAQRRLAQRAMLAGMSGAIAASIDGNWLGALAEVAGDEALDQAIANAADAPVLDPVDGAGLDAAGAALLRATLPEALRLLVDWARPAGDHDPAAAKRCLDLAMGSEAV